MELRKSMFYMFRGIYKLLRGTGVGKFPLVARGYELFTSYLVPDVIFLAEVQGSKMYLDPSCGICKRLFMSGVHESGTTSLLKSLITEGATFVDIGAHVGYYTLIGANRVGAGGKVFAFEPNPRHFALLVRNIEANGYSNVIPVKKAVSNKIGTTNLFLDLENRASNKIYAPHDIVNALNNRTII